MIDAADAAADDDDIKGMIRRLNVYLFAIDKLNMFFYFESHPPTYIHTIIELKTENCILLRTKF